MRTRPFQRLHSTRERALGLLLLAALSWAATAEINHHHGPEAFGGFASLNLAQDTASESGSPSFESRDQGSSSTSPLSSGDCPICQLHQNLFATLFSHSLQIAPAAASILHGPAALVSYSSPTHTSKRGRAPPINL